MAPATITAVITAISAMVSIPITAAIMTAIIRTTAVIPAHHNGRRRINHGRRGVHRAWCVIHGRRRSGINRISRHPDADTHRNVRLRGADNANTKRGCS